MKNTLLSGVFAIAAAVIGAIVGGYIGRQTMSFNVLVNGSTRNVGAESIGQTIQNAYADIRILENKNRELESRLKAIQADYNLILNEKAANKHRESSLFSEDRNNCSTSNTCVSDQNFQVRVRSLSVKGNNVSISLEVKNITEEEREVSIFKEYAIMISGSGERQSKRSNMFRIVIDPGATQSLGYNFEFKNDPSANSFDFVLNFHKPNSSYTFTNIKAT